MAAYEVLLLNTAVPQIQAAQSGDTYVVPRDIAFSAALTLSAGTANGVPYLNASKVLTTGSALTFDGAGFSVGGVQDGGRLTLIGGAGFAGTGLSVYESSTGNNARLRLQQDAGVVVYNATFSSGGNAHAWQIGNSEQMRLTSTGLGIGTSSPTNKLTVYAGADGDVGFFRGGSTRQVQIGTSSTAGYINTDNGSAGFEIRTQGTAKVYLDNSGNVGIGTSSPAYKLGISGVATTYAASASIALYDTVAGVPASRNWLIGNVAAGNYGELNFAVSSAAGGAPTNSKMTLDSSGNLGLGGSAQRATTVGTAALNIFNGTAPVGTLANGISLYSSSGEAYVMDAAGNATLFSPHDAVTNEWIFRSKHTPTGKVLKIDVERLLKFVNDHFGLDAVHEFIED